MERLIEEGKMEPPPKRKTQAEIWEERNREILEHERKYGRITTKSYVHPGTTPPRRRFRRGGCRKMSTSTPNASYR